MTYHAELKPRRRPWLIAAPLILVLVLGAAWTGVWSYAAGEAETRMNAWREQQARAGRVFGCGTQTVGGFPFRIEVRCTGVTTELKDSQPAIAIRLKEIVAVAQVWDPKHLIAEFTGPLTVSDPGQSPHTVASWSLAQASLRGTPSAPERASIVVDGLRLDGATSGNPPLFDSKRAELHARVQFGSWPHNPAIDLAVKLAAASAPSVHQMAAQPLDADIQAVLHGMRDFVNKPLPARLRDWQAAGGKLEIQSARVAQGESLALATGTLALTQRGGLDGALRLTVAGIERLLPAIGGEGGGALNLRLTPALDAIDRVLPGLAQRVPPQKQQSLQAGLLALLGQPAEIEGKRGIAVLVRFNDGKASFGPIPLGQVPLAF